MATVKVEGIRELDRAFRLSSDELKRELRQELKAVGDIVKDDEQNYLRGIGGSGKSVAGIRTQVRSGSVAVQQRHKTVTGMRGDWGARIMSSLATARSKRRPEVIERLEEMLDRIGRRAGF